MARVQFCLLAVMLCRKDGLASSQTESAEMPAQVEAPADDLLSPFIQNAESMLHFTGAQQRQPYAGLIGAPSVNPMSDGCWTNVSLSAKGRRALIIMTSYGAKMKNGKTTGAAIEEFTAPYYTYLDAGMDVDVASILGGRIPVGEGTLTYSQIRYRIDSTLKAKVRASMKIDDVKFADYDVVFMVGGWGAAFDLGYSQVLGAKVAAALEARKPLVGSTCHGALGFAMANKTDGTPWLKGMTATGVTTAQIEKLGIEKDTPMHPEVVLKAKGANYQCIHGHGLLGDVGATSVAVDTQGPIVITGQNQNSACVVAQRQLLFLKAGEGMDEATYAWVPKSSCKSHLKVCYQGYKEDILHGSKVDPLNFCRYGGHASVEVGTCASFGYGMHFETPFGTIAKDPIFRKLTIWKETYGDALVV